MAAHMNPRITPEEHGSRLGKLRAAVRRAELDVFVVSSFESIYYLTGASFEPLERPFFLLVRSEGPLTLLVPQLDYEHMTKAYNVDIEDIRTYWEYPAPAGRDWPGRLLEELGDDEEVGVEPTLRQEFAQHLRGRTVRMEPLVERLRLVKSGGDSDDSPCREVRGQWG